MKVLKPENINYCATVVEIKKTVPLDNCDNVVHAMIFGNAVVVSKDTSVGTKGVFFPVETQLSEAYLSANNLYRDNTLNSDPEKRGYFEKNGRIRCVKFRQNASEGLFMPLKSLEFTGVDLNELSVGDSFDKLNGYDICCKYIVRKRSPGPAGKKDGKQNRRSRRISDQFRFHIDTPKLGPNIHTLNPDDIISITEKLHGTSVVISNVLCKKKLGLRDRIAKFFGVNVVEEEYFPLYSSRKVIKNQYYDYDKTGKGFYDSDVWKVAADDLKEFVAPGMTIYAEIVGFTPTGSPIQGGYDYGLQGTSKCYVYRITTSVADQVHEWSAKQVQTWCKSHGINPVTEVYYGKAGSLFGFKMPDANDFNDDFNEDNILEEWREDFLENMKSFGYMEQDDPYCKNKVPFEGYVVRKETDKIEVYKVKSTAFLEHETKTLDAGDVNIEDEG